MRRHVCFPPRLQRRNRVLVAGGGDVWLDGADLEVVDAFAGVAVGSVLNLGYVSLPLVQVHVTPSFSLDGYASWSIPLRSQPVYSSYSAGFTWLL